MTRPVALLSVLLLSLPGTTVRAVPPPPANDVRIVRVLDGRTVVVSPYGEPFQVRLACIQPGPAAKAALHKLLPPGTWVTLTSRGRATDGVELAEILPSGATVPINLRLVEDGMARPDPTASSPCDQARYREAETRGSTKADPALEAAILRASPSYTRSVLEAGGRPERAHYLQARADLNGDGRQEVFVYLMGPLFCGSGGCTLQLFRPTTNGYALVSSFPISRLPILLSPSRHRGWRDLWRLESGGGAPATYVREEFDGQGYQKRERRPAERGTPTGTPLLTGHPSFRDGTPLEPL